MLDLVHRFKWHNNKSIRVINSEGFERIFLVEGFQEVNYHAIPMYMPYWCTQNHYYYDKPLVELQNVLERLKRKYQGYKAAELMEKREGNQLYAELFTVDYLNMNDDDKFDRHVIDQSFTFLHWNLVE